MDGACGTYGVEKRSTKDFGEKHEGKNYMEDLIEYGRVILKWIFKKYGSWTELNRLIMGTGGGLL